MNINLQEILCCHEWAIEPIAGQQLYNALMTAIANHRDGADNEGMKKTEGFFLSMKKSEECGKLYVGDIHRIENRLYWRDEELADDDQIVNCVVIEGAVTRNGGACTYGSKDHREQIMYANTIPQVVGHIFLVNTPGGMVSAAPDYTQAIENCRMMKKPTVSFIDGICYSMGEWITCQTDYVIAMNEENGFGCIGAMSCGELAPHGSINSVTQERTFILVGKASPDKNREAIEAAAGNDELMQEAADRNTERFHKVVKANRPQVTDDLLTGKCYTASEVMGKLVDEIGDFNRAVECVFQLADGTLKPAREVEVVTEEPKEKPNEESNPENDNAMKEEEEEMKAAEAAQETSPTPDPSPEGEGQVASPTPDPSPEGEGSEASPTPDPSPEGEGSEAEAEEGQVASPTPDPSPEGEGSEAEAEEEPAAEEAVAEAQTEIDRIAETLHNAETMIAEKNKELADKQETLDATSADLAKATDTLAEKQTVIDTLTKECDDANATIDTLNQEKEANAKTIAEQTATIEKLTKQVAELRAEVKELSEKPAPMVDAAAGVPQDNAAAEAPKVKGTVKSEINADDTIEAIRAKLRAKDEQQKTYRHK